MDDIDKDLLPETALLNLDQNENYNLDNFK